MIIRAITLTQPFATLIAIGAKRIETRSWKTNYRGPIAIHAAKHFTISDRAMCHVSPYWDRLDDGGYDGSFDLPLGRIVAIARLIDCVQFTPGYVVDAQENHFGDFTPGRFGWILEGVVRIDPPIEPGPGFHRGLWNWHGYDDFVAQSTSRITKEDTDVPTPPTH